MQLRVITALSFASIVSACGGGGGGSNGPDARPIADTAPPRPCTAPAAGYGSPTATDQGATHYPTDMDGYEEIDFSAGLNTDAMPDNLYISLFNNVPPFDATIMATTVQLTGDQADYASCGACVEVDTDTDEDGTPTDVYFANGGNMILSSVSGMFTGTISNATFVHADIDNDTLETTPNADGCMTTITSISFSGTVEEDPGDLRARTHRKRLHLIRH